MTTIQDIANKFPIFLVGGFVRDTLLGLKPKDSDYVVVATEQEFEKEFPSLKKVGNSFPVYICEGNEVALTRTEKSTGTGYTDFECISGVSIEDDLKRRDITINQLALSLDFKTLIDPCNGYSDLKKCIIRCVNQVAYIEDPLRILRTIRFACRFGFTIEEETFKLLKESAHLLSIITPERIELELRKTYEQSETPSQFFRLLDEIGGLIPHFEELWKAKFVPAGPIEYHPEITCLNHFLQSFDRAKANGYSFEIGIASLLHDFGKLDCPEDQWPSFIGHDLQKGALERFFARHRFSSEVQELSFTVLKGHMRTHSLEKVKKIIKLVRFVRSIRKHQRESFWKCCNCDSTLTEEQWNIIKKTELAINSTKIEISPELAKKGKEAITQFVESEIVKTFKGL